MKRWQRDFARLICVVCDDAWAQMMADPTTEIYLYHRNANTAGTGHLAAAPDIPSGDGWELSIAERIPSWRGKDHARAWISGNVGQFPVLPLEISEGRGDEEVE